LTAVEVNLKQDPILAGCVIKVTGQNDMVVLDGQVPKPESKVKAEELAKRVEGITKVANHLVVVPEEQAQPQNDSSMGP
jgi:osmotically-inducible protein OsmY